MRASTSSSQIDNVMDRLLANRFAPTSTYRLQLHKDFTFENAAAVVPYLKDLGITTLYASPYLMATPGSMHGYDVIDHAQLNPELKPERYEAFIDLLKANGLTHILDIVPNHMGIGSNLNRWWNDVLENGPDAEHGKYFDINWHGSSRALLQGKVLLPVLGKQYAEALESQDLKLICEHGTFFVCYYDRRFPIAPATIPALLGDAGSLQSIARAFAELPTDAYQRASRVAELRSEIAARYENDADFRQAIDRRFAHLNGVAGNVASFDAFDEVLSKQFYRLASWRTAADEINYRRFFDVGTLAAIAMERPEVFDDAHALVLDLLASGKLQGMRLDHPDGLYDPAAYFDTLQNAFVAACAGDSKLRSDCDSKTAAKKPLYVLGEKILAMNESLPMQWPIDGTTGYDFLIQINALFVDRENEIALTQIYKDFTGELQDMEIISHECKLLILDHAMSSELHLLTLQLDELAQKNRASRDFTFLGLRIALRELVASFGVYRTYITDASITDHDRGQVRSAIATAKAHAPHIDVALFDYIEATLLRTKDASREQLTEQVRFAGKFQQLTSPVTAKGIEDTAFYRYHRLISLNEVGGEPAIFGIEADTLHRYLAERQTSWPNALSTLSTHDTKRSEDVRARINLLSEIPDLWRERLNEWRDALEPLKLAIHPNDLYLLLQTLVGAWPTSPDAHLGERLREYMTKALREAKQRTTWTETNGDYEKIVHDLIDAIVDTQRTELFHRSFAPFVARVTQAGYLNSLAQTVLKFFAPGVPDTYQGTELWDFSLVDPDNRRPVDYQQRRKMLDVIASVTDGRPLLQNLDDGLAKLFLTKQSLCFRRVNPELFAKGSYHALKITGVNARHVFAFAREHEGKKLIVIVPRFLERLHGSSKNPVSIDAEVVLPAGWKIDFTNLFTGEPVKTSKLQAAELFEGFPVAVLVG